MGRPPRPICDNLVYHVMNRGNDRGSVFLDTDDHHAFLNALAKTQSRYPLQLFGYCLMTNHFHLLIRPEPGQSISRVMPSLTVAHTWHYHNRYRGVGHVWQGRFRSPVVQDDDHLIVVLRDIEANPLRAKMVTDPADYPWSSDPAHGENRTNPLLAPLPKWRSLGRNEEECARAWREKVCAPQVESELLAIRPSVLTGQPLGTSDWAESRSGLPPLERARRRGRPRKDKSMASYDNASLKT